MDATLLKQHPHRRFNPLTREWVLVSPHRTQRPWQGQMEKAARPVDVEYDPGCYLCPGNSRAGGAANAKYESTFVFDNDFASLLPGTPAFAMSEGDLIRVESEPGTGRVICFSPNHSLTIARMNVPDIRKVVDVWAEQYKDLAANPLIRYVQIFENRGEMMGCSNPHPHGQIWANHSIPNEIAKEDTSQREYFEKHQRPLLADYLDYERKSGERIVCENEHFTALVPFWAIWPFETMLLPHRAVTGMDELTGDERSALAGIMNSLSIRYDNLFEVSFPYSFGLHQRPTDGGAYPHFTLHAHYYPPLLRSATVRKFMVGYELLAMPQRDITPESAAERLRSLSATHYLASA